MMQNLAGRILVGLLIVLLLITAARTARSWNNDSYLGMAAGSLVAMASDLDHGVFYRPLQEADGSYGGTRYLPLYWVIIAVFLKIGIPAVVAGYVTSLLSVLLLLAVIYALFRQLGVGSWLAACGAALVLASETTQFLLATIRSDVLATALNVWGIFFCLASLNKRRSLWAAAACFSLAAFTKATALSGAAAGFLILILLRRGRDAWKLTAETAMGGLIGLVGMYVASSGRALTVIRECASAGYPHHGLFQGALLFLRTSWTNDHPGFLLLLLGLATFISMPPKTWKEAPAVFFVVSLSATVLIFAYLSQDLNHLLDLQVASVVLVMSRFAGLGAESRENQPLRAGLLALIVLLAAGAAWQDMAYIRKHPRRQDKQEVMRRLEHAPTPILAEDPLLPVLMGQKAYMLDPFMYRVLQRQDPHFGDTLKERLQSREFGAVVLFDDPRTPEGRELFRSANFGEDFLTELDNSYQLSSQVGENLIYLPKP